MEKGEVGVLAGQFAALVVVLLVLSNFASGTSPLSTPTIGAVYWGAPSGNIQLTKGVTNTEAANASTISVFYSLAYSTTPATASATKLCLNSGQNDTGGVFIYTNITFKYDAASKTNYISFGPAGQSAGQTCTYTVQLTDSLQQVATWVAIVKLKS